MTNLDRDQLDAVSGGFDLNAMIDAGNDTATRALAGGGFLATGGKALHNAATADGLKLTLEHGRVIAALAGGVGALGWLYGAGNNVGEQMGWWGGASSPAASAPAKAKKK